MRTAALSSFRKLYRIVDSKSLGIEDGLRKGDYSFQIKYGNYLHSICISGLNMFTFLGWYRVKQQTLGAWQPVYTTKTVSPLFILFGIILIPLGVVFFHVSGQIHEINIDYTDCISVERNVSEKCADIIRRDRKEVCNCLINFEILEDMQVCFTKN